MKRSTLFCISLICLSALIVACNNDSESSTAVEISKTPDLIGRIDVGVRPLFLVNDMDEGALKSQLDACKNKEIKPSLFSIGHRGAPLQFPEHTRESYIAAAKMGAGILECDVAFTQDKQLVCRHAQNDLHTSTNILLTPLAEKCTQPFVAANLATGEPARAECRTSDISLAEFKTLRGKMDGFNPNATTVEDYVKGTPAHQTELYAANSGTLMTHQESIELFKQLGVKFTPELKTPVVSMPFLGDYTQQNYAAQMIQDYIDAQVNPHDVYPQSFLLDDIIFWHKNYPEFAKNSVFLDESINSNENSSLAYMQHLQQQGVQILAPALPKMLSVDANQQLVPSIYAKNAAAAGLRLIAWTIERSGPLSRPNIGDNFYYQGLGSVIKKDGDLYQLIDVLAKDVGVIGIFSDWPATTTYYANCTDR